MSEGHSIGIRPLPDGLKVPAHVLRLKVWPVALDSVIGKVREVVECEDSYVTLAHEVQPESFDAVVWLVLVFCRCNHHNHRRSNSVITYRRGH
jgi:hypothetical protein